MPRLGIIADVHANLIALSTVLDRLAASGIDDLVVAGDLVGYGAQPNECVSQLRERAAIAVAGNHDLIAIGRLDDKHTNGQARRSLAWTKQALTPESRAYLGALPLTAFADGGVVVTHGSLDDPEARITDATEVSRALVALEGVAPGSRFLVVGNTHRTVVADEDGRTISAQGDRLRLAPGHRYLINPGSVGQSREIRSWARCAVLDTDEGWLELLTVRYDIEQARRLVAAAGLQPRSLHWPPGRALLRPRRTSRHVVRRIIRKLNKGSSTPGS